MIMKKEFCMMAIGLLLASCSADEEIANVQTSEANAISFNVVSNNPQTKATPITSTTFKDHPFEVFAFKGGEHYMGTAEEGVKIKYDQTAWIYDNPNDIYYWPHTAALDFYAISPSGSLPEGMYNIQGNTQNIYYLVNDEYGNGGINGYQNVDLMYALAKNQTRDLHNGIVTLGFRHALSQVVFQATKKDEQMHVQIQKMELFTLPLIGTFTFPTTASEDGLWAYDRLAETPLTIGLDLNGEGYIDVNHVSDPISLSMHRPVLVIPATLKAWHPELHLISQAYDEGESYLKIKCKIWLGEGGDGVYKVGSSTDFADIYVPFEADWKQGKRYVYTLRFGAGYDENGNEHDIVPITFTATVDDWEDNHLDKDDF